MKHQTCLVCGATANGSHFGAPSCRACAAFFKRKVVGCREIRHRCGENAIAGRKSVCQKCRFEKCLSVGMMMTAVYRRLKRNRPPSSTEHVFRPEVVQLFEQAREVYSKLEDTRKVTFHVQDDHIPQLYNYKQLNTVLKTDFRIMISTMGAFFDSMTNVSECQKKLLLNNFIFKFFLLECGFKSRGKFVLHLGNGNFMDFENMRHFYHNPDNQKLTEGSMTLMRPYWVTTGRTIITHLDQLQMDLQEFLLLSAVLYWDQSVADLSEESTEVCRQMRTRVLGELTAYEQNVEKERDHSLRVGDVMFLLTTLENTVHLIEETRDILAVNGMCEVHEAIYAFL